MMNNRQQVKIGDWVKGKTKNGELIHGYIEHISEFQDAVKIYVIACDNEEMVGKMIGLSRRWIEPLLTSMKDDEQHVLHLIDLALSTEDKEWFMELSAQLNSIRQKGRNSKSNIIKPTARNRVWTSGIKEV